MKLKIMLEQCKEGGYSVYVPGLPGCVSAGETKDEALDNIKEAIDHYLNAVEEEQTAIAMM